MSESLSVGNGKKPKISFTTWSCPKYDNGDGEHSLLEHTDTQIEKCEQFVALWRSIDSRGRPWTLRHW